MSSVCECSLHQGLDSLSLRDILVAFNVGCSNSPGIMGAELSEMEQVQEKNSAHTDTLPGEL